MIRFFDTSALAKRYVSEPGSAMVRATLRAHQVAVARVTYAELAASVARAARGGVITDAQRDAIFTRLEADFAKLRVIEVRGPTLAVVPRLVTTHALRGYDAVQLAAALALAGLGEPVEFWSADEALCRAALAEGMRVITPR